MLLQLLVPWGSLLLFLLDLQNHRELPFLFKSFMPNLGQFYIILAISSSRELPTR